MGLELIIFIASILFGILLYWRESNGNNLYRFVNKIVNSKELQMKPEDKTGFVFQQKFILRLVFISFLFLMVILILQFLIPLGFDYNTVSIFASSIFGTLVGTYVANFVIKSGKVIEKKGDSLSHIVEDVVEKGKGFIEDLKSNNEDGVEDIKEEDTQETPNPNQKSARERLKDKGLM
ncbi:hypothetical protein D7030_01920 [Flavobacteriaceae bacterium AU392]|nr:hypothetical protein D1817_08395 [Flavobacteriaceae bacterium]RKM85453.1 hypothetical protein D7030_01920 [Flavobacteriaceae bacterium AU392]